MCKHVCLRARLFFITALALLWTSTTGQDIKPYVGFHGGINFSLPVIISSYNLVTSIDDDLAGERNYETLFNNIGHQIGFSLYLQFTDHLLIGFLPETGKYSYGYSSSMEFNDSQGNIASTYINESKINLNYITFPLLIQYHILKDENWSPYLFAGGSYGLLRNAQHDVNSITILETESGPIEFYDPSTSNSSVEFIRSKWNVFGGIGTFYDFTQWRFGLDVSYWLGLHNIVNEANRYNNQAISGSTYDITDDVRLNHLVINISVLFPINKQINKGSLDCVVPKRRK
jgi:hypothetical protein